MAVAAEAAAAMAGEEATGTNPDENPLLKTTDLGLYCQRGDFFSNPWQPVDRAVVTHAHADHRCRGSGDYLMAPDGLVASTAIMSQGSTRPTQDRSHEQTPRRSR